MFYRICRLLTLNIQLVFVFDGPRVPWKRGRRGGHKVDWEELRLLKQMLTCFGIPYQEAPGEAEAECARLQILGIVDAVWSQDSDCLMFGCTSWIHDDRVAKEKGNDNRSKDNTKKNAKTARVVRASDMQEKLGLSPEALVLFAMLVGGDYDTTGLRGCGAGIALQAARNEHLVQSLVSCQNQRDCTVWGAYLAECLRMIPRGGSIPVPGDYPNYKTLQKYYKPKVSSDETLLSSARLNRNNVRPIHELGLLEVTSSRFNIWGKGYLNWVGPILLVRSMSEKSTSLPPDNIHDVWIVKQRAKKTEEQSPMRLFERKISFSPFQVTSLRREDFEGERLGYWAGTRDIPFDSTHRVDCELPDFWLSKALPLEVYDPPAPQPKSKIPKRKQQTETDGQNLETSAAKKPKPHKSAKNTDMRTPLPIPGNSMPSRSEPVASITPSREDVPARPATREPTSSSSCSKRRTRPPASQQSDVVELSDDDDNFALHFPSKRKKHRLTQLQAAMSSSAYLESSTRPMNSTGYIESSAVSEAQNSTVVVSGSASDDSEDRELQAALAASMAEYAAAQASSSPHRIGRFGTLPSEERLINRSTPTPKASYTALPYGNSTLVSRQLFTEGSFGVGTGPSASSLRDPSTPSPAPFTSPSGVVSTKNTSSTAVHPQLAVSSELDQIREARLRHFAQNSSPVTTIHSTMPAQMNRITPTSQIPEGVVCIDLTDD